MIKDWISGFRAKISPQDRIDLYGFLVTLIRTGYDLQSSMGEVSNTLERQIEQLRFGTGKLKKTQSLYRYLESEQRQGRSLHVSLAGRIPDAEIMMLMAGAEGDLTDGLKAASVSAANSAKMVSTIRSAVTYPLVIGAVVIFAMNWMGNNLLPVMARLKDVNQWTSGEQNLYWMTTNVGVWFPILMVALIGAYAVTTIVNLRVVGQPREAIAWLPPFNVIRRVSAATYLDTLSSLIKAGVPVKDALSTMRDRTGSPYLRHYLNQAVNNMRAGGAKAGPGKAIGSRLFSPWIMVKLDIYSRASSDQFADTMTEIAQDAIDEAIGTLGTLSKWINIALMLSAAFVIGYTIITMYGITSSLQSGLAG